MITDITDRINRFPGRACSNQYLLIFNWIFSHDVVFALIIFLAACQIYPVMDSPIVIRITFHDNKSFNDRRELSCSGQVWENGGSNFVENFI
jgi:hypothetical protein